MKLKANIFLIALAAVLISYATMEARTYWYEDFDNDGYGNILVRKQQQNKPRGNWVQNTSDCNDSLFAVHPGMAELCNGLDDNCSGMIDEGVPFATYYLDANHDGWGDVPVIDSVRSCSGIIPTGYTLNKVPVADLTIRDMGIAIIKNFVIGNMVDYSFTGGQKGGLKPRDITLEPQFSLATSIGFTGYQAWSGQTTQGDHASPKRDTVAIGGSGIWYNWQGEDDIKGAGCKSCPKLDGKDVDFYNSFIEFVRKAKSEAIISANVDNGSLDDLKWKLSRVHAINPKQRMIIIFGQEENLGSGYFGGDINKYLDKVNPWMDSCYRWYPGCECIANTAPIFTGATRDIEWNNVLATSGHHTAVCAYIQQDNCTDYNGNLAHDITELEASFGIVKSRMDQIAAKFPGKPIYITQFNCSEAFIGNPFDIVYPGAYISTSWMVGMFKTIMEYNAQHSNSVAKVMWQTVKNITGGGVYDNNGNAWVLMNKFFTSDAHYITATYNSDISVFGVKSGDQYRLIFENRSGVDLALPRSVSLDGYYFNPTWSGTFLNATDLLSTTMAPYTPLGIIKGYSIAYCVVTSAPVLPN